MLSIIPSSLVISRRPNYYSNFGRVVARNPLDFKSFVLRPRPRWDMITTLFKRCPSPLESVKAAVLVGLVTTGLKNKLFQVEVSVIIFCNQGVNIDEED